MGGSVPDLNEVGEKAPPQLADNFRREVAGLLNRDSIGFPGAQPVSFARKHLKELRNKDYYVCEKSDGVRCLLYFTQDPSPEGPKEIHYLIDRKNEYYYVADLHFPLAKVDPAQEVDWASFHIDTILDGELLFDIEHGQKILKFLVFDCLLLDGMNMMARTLDKRLAYFMDKIYKPYAALRAKFPEDCQQFRFILQKKDFQVSYGTEMLFRETIPQLPHGTDGLIFTCKDTPYKFGTDPHILKWKPADENTVDFKLSLVFPSMEMENGQAAVSDGANELHGPESYDYDAIPAFVLYVHYSERDDRPFSTMYATQEEWAEMIRWSIEHKDGLDSQIVECHKDDQQRWRFNRFRNDKLEANHHSVVVKVMESIEDSVSEDELINAAAEIKSAWKKRNAEAAEREKQEREQRAKAAQKR